MAAELSDQEIALLHWREVDRRVWKDIRNLFEQRFGLIRSVSALHIRYKRLKTRLRVWTDADEEAIFRAYHYWESDKYKIISEKVSYNTSLE